MIGTTDIWKTQVRDYEVDFQGIVNNAVYMHYLDNARALFLNKIGLNVQKLATEGINMMLISSELLYKKSLNYQDSFCVKTTLSRISRFKFLFDQSIYLETTNVEVLAAKNLTCCFNIKTNKPCIPAGFENLEILAL